MVFAGQAGECVPVYGPRPDKLAHRSAVLATLAKIWEHYGFRSLLVTMSNYMYITCMKTSLKPLVHFKVRVCGLVLARLQRQKCAYAALASFPDHLRRPGPQV